MSGQDSDTSEAQETVSESTGDGHGSGQALADPGDDWDGQLDQDAPAEEPGVLTRQEKREALKPMIPAMFLSLEPVLDEDVLDHLAGIDIANVRVHVSVTGSGVGKPRPLGYYQPDFAQAAIEETGGGSIYVALYESGQPACHFRFKTERQEQPGEQNLSPFERMMLQHMQQQDAINRELVTALQELRSGGGSGGGLFGPEVEAQLKAALVGNFVQQITTSPVEQFTKAMQSTAAVAGAANDLKKSLSKAMPDDGDDEPGVGELVSKGFDTIKAAITKDPFSESA